MMEVKEQTIFVAGDGARFDDRDLAVAHARACDTISEIMSALPAPPADHECKFANGGGYIQHDPATWTAVLKRLRLLAIQLAGGGDLALKWFSDDVHPSWGARMIDDYRSLAPLRGAWYRVQCVDSEFREWGQPYYADHSDGRRTERCLNPGSTQESDDEE